jgi:hypothetical protein
MGRDVNINLSTVNLHFLDSSAEIFAGEVRKSNTERCSPPIGLQPKAEKCIASGAA